MSKRSKHLIVSDMHVPRHSSGLVDNLFDLLGSEEFVTVTIIGDFIDCDAPSTWSSGTAAEYADTLQSECKTASEILGNIRNYHDGEIFFHTGNHEARIKKYTNSKAPALRGLECLSIPKLLGFEEFGIMPVGTYHELLPGWITTHGDVASLNKTAGLTALGLAEKLSSNVIMGHTHRLGIVYSSNGRYCSRTFCGMEVGHLMDVEKAAYVEDMAPNWQAGVGIIDVVDGIVYPRVVRLYENE